jgi:hypothetical protein
MTWVLFMNLVIKSLIRLMHIKKAAELDPTNKHIQQRLNTLRQTLASQNGDIKPPPSKLPIVQEALHPFPITKFI